MCRTAALEGDRIRAARAVVVQLHVFDFDVDHRVGPTTDSRGRPDRPYGQDAHLGGGGIHEAHGELLHGEVDANGLGDGSALSS